MNVALGGVDPNTGGLVGARRGGSSADVPYFNCNGDCGTHRDQVAFTGDIATLAGPDGSHFFGKNDPNIVIGFELTGTHNIGRDIPLDPIDTSPGAPPASQQVQDQSGSTYHIGVGLGPLPPQTQTFDGEFKGYAAGIYTQPASSLGLSGGRSPVGILTSGSDGMTIDFNRAQNTLSASINLTEADPDGDPFDEDDKLGGLSIGFGDSGTVHGRSAYIDNLHYAAIETPDATTAQVFSSEDNGRPLPTTSVSATSYIVSGDQLGVTSFFTDTFTYKDQNGNRPFCQDCSFLQWGAWGTRANITAGGSDSSTNSTTNVHLGWWVAGDIPTIGQLPTQGAATYSGNALGDIAANVPGSGWQTYVAAGKMDMSWDFRCRSGTLSISNFDANGPMGALNVSGKMSIPGIPGDQASAQFNGALTGSLGQGSIAGSANGAFMRGPVNINAQGAPIVGSIPQGVAGNWNVGNDAYKAAGIFAGGRP